MKYKLPFLLLAPAAAASAQSPFLDPAQVTIGTEVPNVFTAADFTGDGLNDVVAASDRLLLFRGDGTGAFDDRLAVTPGGLDILGIASGDVDADGDPDILLIDAASGARELAWYENSGSGATFTRRSLVSDVPTGTETQLADVDGDGDLDFVVRTTANNSLIWFENAPGLTNLVARPVAPFVNVVRRFEDVDQDGLVDLVQERSAHLSGQNLPSGVSVAFGTSVGVFASPAFLFTSVSRLTDARLRDYDGDGDLDGVALRRDNNELILLEATSPGVFAAPVSLGFLAEPERETDLDFVEDFNGDGLLDVVFLSARLNIFDFQTRWVASLPGGGLSSPQDISAGGDFRNPFDQVIDFTGDGLPDGLRFRGGDLEIAANIAAPGGPLVAEAVETPTEGVAHIDAAWLDVDGDGNLDILGLQSGFSTLSVFTNDGQGSFTPDGTIDLGSLEGLTIEAHDFDGDGDDDLLLLGTPGSGNQISVLRNDGNRSFQEVVVRGPAALFLGDPQVQDLDGDGDLDIVVSNPTGQGPIRWFRNEGPSLIFTQILVNTPFGTTVGDIDGDGLPDLVAMGQGPMPVQTQTVVWRRNLGAGVFSPQAILLDAFNGSRVSLGDINSDGMTDIVLNQGGTIFAATAIIPGSQYGLLTSLGIDSTEPLQRLLSLDLTADGREDLVGRFDLGTAQVYVNPGPGGFASAGQVFDSIAVVTQPRFADANKDGDLDALGLEGGEIYVAPNGTVQPIGINVCGPANATSTGFPARMAADGSLDVTDMDVTLIAVGVPVNMTGIFVASRTVGAPQPIVGSQGSICLNGSVGRFNRAQEIQNSGSEGVMRLVLDVNSIPQGNGRIPRLCAVSASNWKALTAQSLV